MNSYQSFDEITRCTSQIDHIRSHIRGFYHSRTFGDLTQFGDASKYDYSKAGEAEADKIL
jgi:hypothetical protein